MANSLLQNQVYTIINAINAQVKGGGTTQAVDSSSFVTVAQTALLTGYDNLMNAVSQVLSDTIFSHRPYEAILDILYNDSIRWGNHVRKIVPLDDNAERDDRLPLTDGQSVDPWIVNKPKVKQFNFYGQEVFQRHKSIPKDQIDTAFSNENEFARFVAMIYAHANDQITQDRENLARLALGNFIAGKTLTDTAGVIHLLTEYNAQTGLSLTAQTVYQPANYAAFIRWASARIMSVSDDLRNRGYRYHKNLTGVNIPRHTGREYQRFIMFAPAYRQVEASTLATTWHDDYIKGFDAFEAVNFFQNPDDPATVKVTPAIIDNDGEFVQGAETTVSNIFGMIFDRDAVGMTSINQWSSATPLNPRGGYSNMFWHYTLRYYNDFTENSALFLLN